MLLSALPSRVDDPEDKVDYHRQQKHDGQHGRPEAVVEAGLTSLPYTLGSPMIRRQGIYHGNHGDTGKQEGGDEGGPVTKIQHADGQGAEDNGEVEP